MNEQAESGETKVVFCAKRGINLGTFYGWAQRLRKAGVKGSFAKVEVSVAPRHDIAVDLPGGVRVHVSHTGDAAETALLIRSIAGC